MKRKQELINIFLSVFFYSILSRNAPTFQEKHLEELKFDTASFSPTFPIFFLLTHNAIWLLSVPPGVGNLNRS